MCGERVSILRQIRSKAFDGRKSQPEVAHATLRRQQMTMRRRQMTGLCEPLLRSSSRNWRSSRECACAHARMCTHAARFPVTYGRTRPPACSAESACVRVRMRPSACGLDCTCVGKALESRHYGSKREFDGG